MKQHKREARGRVLHSYDADSLGAPFKVTLIDSVTEEVDPTSGEKLITIPDLNGLVRAVVHSRVCDPRKLTGPELKFVRLALDVQANKLAAFLSVTPEHLSRCEAGAKTLSPANEKALRAFSFLAAASENARNVLDGFLESRDAAEVTDEIKNVAVDLMKFFFSMKIMPIFDVAEELGYEFTRCHRRQKNCVEDMTDGAWKPQQKAA